jgi:ribosome-interacting GTPase 1
VATIEEQIKAVEEEIQNTPYNKATQRHIGLLKAKLSRLKDLAEKRKSSGGATGLAYAVKKSGNATVGLVGFPSVGKSTLLNKITDAKSEVAAYKFTTLTVVPGLLDYRGAKIQVLDMPGMIKGAAQGKGRGREVLSVVRSLDLVILMGDVFETNIDVLAEELYQAGVRLNTRLPEITIKKRDRGGIVVNSTVKLTKVDEDEVRGILNEYGYVSADVVLRQDISAEELIDYIAENRIYIPAIVAINKIDLVGAEYLEHLFKRLSKWHVIPISADKEIGLDELKEKLFDRLKFMSVYMKPQGKDADMVEPLVVKAGSTVGMICDTLHREFRRKFRYANVWGKSAKFPGQTVGLNHVMKDQDILTIVVRKG